MQFESAKEILRIHWPITLDELKRAYRNHVVRSHPDKFTAREDQDAAREITKAINEAFELLCEFLEQSRDAADGKSQTEFERYARSNEGRPRHTYNGKPFTPGFPDETVFEWFIRSSWIISVGYHEESQTLYIKIAGSGVYEYAQVPREVFVKFVKTSTPGKYAHAHILGHYAYRKCDEPNRPYRGKICGQEGQ